MRCSAGSWSQSWTLLSWHWNSIYQFITAKFSFYQLSDDHRVSSTLTKLSPRFDEGLTAHDTAPSGPWMNADGGGPVYLTDLLHFWPNKNLPYIESALTRICHNQILWYSEWEYWIMRYTTTNCLFDVLPLADLRSSFGNFSASRAITAMKMEAKLEPNINQSDGYNAVACVASQPFIQWTTC